MESISVSYFISLALFLFLCGFGTAASHDFDCNLPPDGGSDENQPIETSEAVHDSLGSARKIPVQHTENGVPVRAVSDKGKCIENFPPLLSRNSSKNNYIQVNFWTPFSFSD